MKEAPMTCPKCGADKEWRCTNDPTNNDMNPLAKSLIYTNFGLVGEFIAKLLYKGKKLKYHCEKCGFQGTYSPD